MKHLSSIFGLLALSTFMSLPTFAQSAGSQQENNAPQQQQKSNAHQDNGATWLLKSRKVDLGEHVGHQVTATGFLRDNQTTQTPSTPNTTVDNAQDEEGAGGAGTINTLHVVNVKMVSETCSTK